MGLEDSNVCLQLEFTEEEVNKFEAINGTLFLYNGVLPISRIKKIYFNSAKQMAQTVASLNISTAFLQKELYTHSKFIDNKLPVYKLKNNSIGDFTEKIKQYDRYLGAISLMRLSKNKLAEFSETYFSTLSFFNTKIRDDYKNNSNERFSDKFHDIFKGEKEFKELLGYLNKEITEDDVYNVAKEEGQTIIKNKLTKEIDFSILNGKTLIIAVLYYYGVADEARYKNIDTLILDSFDSLKQLNKKEVIALCYGYNRGYSVFSKDIKGNRIKFEMNSKLDYYSVESIFQYVFNAIISSEFYYIDNYCPILLEKEKSSNDYKILDVVIKGPKVISEKYYMHIVDYFNNLSFKNITISFNKLIKDFIKKIYVDTYAEMQESFEKEKIKLNRDVNLQLLKIDKTLFEEIDEDGNGILDDHEISAFLNRIRAAQDNIGFERPSIKNEVVQQSNILNKNDDFNKDELIKRVLDLKNLSWTDFKKEVKINRFDIPKGKDSDIRDRLIIKIINSSNKRLL
jgi:hypothetical protein